MVLTGTHAPTVITPPKVHPLVRPAHLVSSARPQVPCLWPANLAQSSPPTQPEIVVCPAQAPRIARIQPIQPPVPTQNSMDLVNIVTHAPLGTAAQEGLPQDATRIT